MNLCGKEKDSLNEMKQGINLLSFKENVSMFFHVVKMPKKMPMPINQLQNFFIIFYAEFVILG